MPTTLNESTEIEHMPAPRVLAGFTRGEITDYESANPGLGWSYPYHGPDCTLTLYYYDMRSAPRVDGPSSPEVMEQYKSSLEDAQQMVARGIYEKAALVGCYPVADASGTLTFMGAELAIVQSGQVSSSHLLLTAAKGMFIKVRVTGVSGPETAAATRRFAAEYAKALWPRGLEAPACAGLEVSVAGLKARLFGPFQWRFRELGSDGCPATEFVTYRPGQDPDDELSRPCTSLLIADGTSDPEEPNVEGLQPAGVAAIDTHLRTCIERQFAAGDEHLIQWGPSLLADVAGGRGLITAYQSRDKRGDWHCIALRIRVNGRNVVALAGFDKTDADTLAGPVSDMIRSMERADSDAPKDFAS